MRRAFPPLLRPCCPKGALCPCTRSSAVSPGDPKGVRGFALRTGDSSSGLTNKRVGLLGVPYDGGATFMRGSTEAPAAIRAALSSSSANRWSELGIEITSDNGFDDLGDAEVREDHMLEDIETAAKAILDKGQHRLFALGGDHSVSYPLLKAHGDLYREEGLTLVHFDAHSDLYQHFENDLYSNASPFARIMEAGLVRRLIQIAVRTQTQHLRDQAKRFGVEMIEMRHIGKVTNLEVKGPVYISFDLDALDPAFAPGVSHHEPGGLSTREALNIIHDLGGDVIGADLVELNPGRDINGMSAKTAAKLVKEISGKMLLNKT